ncbi:MAG TPA: tripartite tricarboxylate transporter substrate binding protein [Burkholderiaceae bacterium]|nr:tripartite tricarboxylate transporter substrate binding protein [Burkholderiaceae bacterium]
MKRLSFRSITRILSIGLVGIAATLPNYAAAAEDWPSRDIKIIVPFGAGGASDGVARALGQRLSESLGQSVVVENRTGAGGSIGVGVVARSKPDGYTFLLGSTSEIVQYPLIYPNANYDVQTDLTTISSVSSSPLVLIANSELEVDTLSELVAKSKATPHGLVYGSAGIGASTHLAVELLMSAGDFEMRHIPYRGSANIVSDVVAGTLHTAMPTLSAIKPFATDERLKLIAVSSADSTPLLPGVPGMAEAGLEDFDVALWTGLFAPAGVDAEIVEKMHAAVQDALQSSELQQAFSNLGAVPVLSSRADFEQLIENETQRWKTLIAENNIVAE